MYQSCGVAIPGGRACRQIRLSSTPWRSASTSIPLRAESALSVMLDVAAVATWLPLVASPQSFNRAMQHEAAVKAEYVTGTAFQVLFHTQRSACFDDDALAVSLRIPPAEHLILTIAEAAAGPSFRVRRRQKRRAAQRRWTVLA
ncbi:hypothetical protein PSAB6_260103 [Paraburkholderia sabiae]|nr:hypothetical protein PSAB6_260103 [Paraburkholderia sabiae]